MDWDEHHWEVKYLLEKPWFDFPTPFRRGDILVEAEKPWAPFVLEDMVSWKGQQLIENGFSPEDIKSRDEFRARLRTSGDTSDMNYYAWYYGEYNAGLYYETGMNYMNLEYYHGSLEGEYRTLKPVSCFFKEWVQNKIMDIALLCNAYATILLEKQWRDFHESLIHGGCTSQALRDYGVIEE